MMGMTNCSNSGNRVSGTYEGEVGRYTSPDWIGTRSKYISLGFTPKKVRVIKLSGDPVTYSTLNADTFEGIATAILDSNGSIVSVENAVTTAVGASSLKTTKFTRGGNNDITTDNSDVQHYVKVAIVDGGFVVCGCAASNADHTHTNMKGVTYKYVAYR